MGIFPSGRQKDAQFRASVSRVFATYNRAAQFKASGIAQLLQVFSHQNFGRRRIIPERNICSQCSEINFISPVARREYQPNFATLSRPPTEFVKFLLMEPEWRDTGGDASRPFFLTRNSWRGGGAVAAHGLRIEFARHLDGGLADIEQRASAFLHEAGRALVETLRQLSNRLYLLEQFVGFAVGEAGYDIVDLGHGAVETRKRRVGLADDAVDRVALAG